MFYRNNTKQHKKNKEKTLIFQRYSFLKTVLTIIHHSLKNYNLPAVRRTSL